MSGSLVSLEAQEPSEKCNAPQLPRRSRIAACGVEDALCMLRRAHVSQDVCAQLQYHKMCDGGSLFRSGRVADDLILVLQ